MKFALRLATLSVLVAALVLPQQIQGIVSSTIIHWLNQGPECNSSNIALDRWAAPEGVDLDMPVGEIISISQQRSQTFHGQATLQVTVAARPADQTWFLVTEGRYGQRSTSDFETFEEEAVKRPSPTDCTQWNRSIERTQEGNSWESVIYFDGLWGQNTYCFTVLTGKNYTDINSGNFEESEPQCHTIKWNPSWGWMESPGNA